MASKGPESSWDVPGGGEEARPHGPVRWRGQEVNDAGQARVGRFLAVLVVLCFLLAGFVWWQILRGL